MELSWRVISTRSTSTESRCCAVPRARSTARARSAACFGSSPTCRRSPESKPGRASESNSVKDGDLGYSGNAMVNVPLGPNSRIPCVGYLPQGGWLHRLARDHQHRWVGKSANLRPCEEHQRCAELRRPRVAAVQAQRCHFHPPLGVAQNIKVDESTIIEADPVTLRPLNGLTQSRFVPQFTDTRYRVYNGTGTFDLGFGQLTSSTSYSTQLQHLRTDLTFPLSSLLEHSAVSACRRTSSSNRKIPIARSSRRSCGCQDNRICSIGWSAPITRTRRASSSRTSSPSNPAP